VSIPNWIWSNLAEKCSLDSEIDLKFVSEDGFDKTK